MALKIERTVRQVRPDSWHGVQTKEEVTKAALFGILQDDKQVEEMFSAIKSQGEYR